MSILKGAAVVGQSGGPTSAINASLAGVIKGFFDNKGCISALYGMRNGIEGFLKEDLLDLGSRFSDEKGDLDKELFELLVQTPASALGSCRKKLPDLGDTEFYDNLLSIFKKHDIRYFFYIGGNDSMDTVAKLTAYLDGKDYEMRVVGIPKTIDNDLVGTDHTPGFGSAAKYIATTINEIIRDCSVYTTKAVTIVELMGRDSGWLTASAGIPRIINGTAPDYIYLPEVPFTFEGFYSDIEAAFNRHPNVVIAVSEGARLSDGRYVGESAQSGAVDVFGHKYLEGTGKALEKIVKSHFGCKVRSIELNLPQRCAAHLASATDLEESVNCGSFGVVSAVCGKSGVMISMIRNKADEYGITYESMDISNIANAVKTVPSEFITPEGNNVTDECLRYLYPLIQGETFIRFKGGLPEHLVL